jgi:Caspase domain
MASGTSPSNDWAIVVGIRRYPGLGDLNGPENDASAFYDWVMSATGGGVPPAQAWPLLSSNFPTVTTAIDASPNDHEVQKLFEKLDDCTEKKRQEGELQLGRRLYLYFSGHGCATTYEDSALITANATRRRIYHVPGKCWADYFFRAGYFREIALFMDCCRERQERVAQNIPSWVSKDLPDVVDQSRRFYGFGAKWSRMAREKEYPPGSGLTRGIFTLALLDGLSGAAYDAATQFYDLATNKLRAQVTAASLGNFLYNNMRNYLSDQDLADPLIAKEPDLVYDRDGGRAFVFNTVDVPLFPVAIELPMEAGGKLLEIRGEKFQVVKSEAARAPVHRVELSRGNYEVRVKDVHLETLFQLTGVMGKNYVVSF